MIDPTFIDHRLADRGRLLRHGLALAIVLLLVGALLLAVGRGTFSDRVTVSADVDDVGGALVTGSDVKLDGVIVGRVTAVQRRDDAVRLTLSLEGRHADGVPAGVRARILPASVFGTSFVDLVAPSGGGAPIRAGAVVAQDQDAATIELQDTLDSTYDVVTAASPAEVATTLEAVASALDGRGESLGETVETLDAYLGRLEPHLPLLREDLRLLGDELTVVADVMPDLLDATDSGLVAARTLTQQQRRLSALLTDGDAFVDEADRLLADQHGPIVDAVGRLAIVTDAFHDERDGLPDGFRQFSGFARKGQAVFGDGPWMRTALTIATGQDAAYTSADCPVFAGVEADNCPDGGAP